MKKLFTILFFLISIAAYSQPVMDGNFDGEGVWGEPKATADGNVGWAGANAKKLYTTFDATYFYLGAEVTAATWQAWAFIINTKVGGGTSDSWLRNITYNHSSKPDYAARGHFNSYAEIYKWNGSAWQRDPDGGLNSTEFGESITGSNPNGWVEIRVPRSTLGSPLVSDVEFYITGDNNSHGSFDACPNDDNSIDWGDPTTLSNYAPDIPFPVELISFTASAIAKDVKLNWQTATEVDNYGFEILRSAQNDKVNWTKIGFVNGHGNSNSTKNYSFTDRDLSNGSYSYRLKQIDADGNFAYSPIVEVIINNLPSQFELSQNYPNPFNPSTLIKYSLPSKEFVQLRVFNVLGNEITTLVNQVQKAGNYTIEFNPAYSSLNPAAGIYFYRLEAGSFVDSRKMTLVK